MIVQFFCLTSLLFTYNFIPIQSYAWLFVHFSLPILEILLQTCNLTPVQLVSRPGLRLVNHFLCMLA